MPHSPRSAVYTAVWCRIRILLLYVQYTCKYLLYEIIEATRYISFRTCNTNKVRSTTTRSSSAVLLLRLRTMHTAHYSQQILLPPHWHLTYQTTHHTTMWVLKWRYRNWLRNTSFVQLRFYRLASCRNILSRAPLYLEPPVYSSTVAFTCWYFIYTTSWPRYASWLRGYAGQCRQSGRLGEAPLVGIYRSKKKRCVSVVCTLINEDRIKKKIAPFISGISFGFDYAK